MHDSVPPADAPTAAVPPAPQAARSLTIRLGARTVETTHRPGTTVLQSARSAGLRAPSSCETGSCGTCIAHVVEGHAAMRNNDVLGHDEVAEGWVLTCQAVPTSEHTHVVYE